MKKVYFSIVLIAATLTNAQQFQEIPTVFKDYSFSAAAIGDYNNDGFQDVFFTGAVDDGGLVTHNEFYKNTNGVFSVQQVFTDNAVHFNNGNVKFIDFDNDGFLDVVSTGLSYGDVVNYQQYRFKNNGETFDQIANTTGKIYGGIEVFDFNHDGQQDYAINGVNFEGEETVYKLDLYSNTGGDFEKVDAWLPGSQSGDFKVADFNNDHYLDVIMYGFDLNYSPFFRFYLNDGEGSLVAAQEFTPLASGKMAFADFNADGFLDAIASGRNENDEIVLKLLTNNGNGSFTESEITEGALSESFIETGDINGDGYYDFVIIGDNDYNGFVNIFTYNPSSNSFDLQENTGIYNLGSGGTVKLFDYNNDHHLDVLTNGFDWNGAGYPSITKLYKNTTTEINEKPTAPQTLNTEVVENKVIFHWENSSDDTTPEKALRYELSVGSESGKADIAKYEVTTNGWFLDKTNLPQQIFWSVKSIDASHVLSESSAEQTVDFLSVSENTALEFALYPNPANDVLNFKSKEKIKFAKIINIAGQVVQKQMVNGNKMQLNNLTSGLYIVEIQFENGNLLSRKFLKK